MYRSGVPLNSIFDKNLSYEINLQEVEGDNYLKKHDLKEIRVNSEAFDEGLRKRGLEPKSYEILKIDAAIPRIDPEKFTNAS